MARLTSATSSRPSPPSASTTTLTSVRRPTRVTRTSSRSYPRPATSGSSRSCRSVCAFVGPWRSVADIGAASSRQCPVRLRGRSGRTGTTNDQLNRPGRSRSGAATSRRADGDRADWSGHADLPPPYVPGGAAAVAVAGGAGVAAEFIRHPGSGAPGRGGTGAPRHHRTPTAGAVAGERAGAREPTADHARPRRRDHPGVGTADRRAASGPPGPRRRADRADHRRRGHPENHRRRNHPEDHPVRVRRGDPGAHRRSGPVGEVGGRRRRHRLPTPPPEPTRPCWPASTPASRPTWPGCRERALVSRPRANRAQRGPAPGPVCTRSVAGPA